MAFFSFQSKTPKNLPVQIGSDTAEGSSATSTVPWRSKTDIPEFQNLPSNWPQRLIIPSIKIDTTFQYVGLTGNNNIGTPTNYYQVAWFKLSSVPGEPGTAVISGHLDTINSPYGIFYNLDKLSLGDEIEIENKQSQLFHFIVSDIKTIDYTSSSEQLMQPSDQSRIVLVTCAGNWIKSQKVYDKRLVVFAQLAQ